MVSRKRMRNELHPDVLQSIEKLLAEKTPTRTIEAMTGAGRTTIRRIKAGEHVSQVRGSRYQRCPEGHLTILPCRTCAARAARRNKPSRRRSVA